MKQERHCEELHGRVLSQRRGNLTLRRKDLFEHGCVQTFGDSHVVVAPPRYDVQGLGFDTLLNGCT